MLIRNQCNYTTYKSNKKRINKYERKQNRFLGGHQPFAFNKTADGKLEVNPKEAEIYKAIINLKNNKVPLRKISEVIKNKYARKLHYSYISKLLNRPQLSETIASVGC